MNKETFGYDYSFSKNRSKNNINNYKIVENLTILRDYTKKLKQPFKSKSYQNAINNIKLLDFDISKSNVDYLIKHRLVGDKIYKKVIEFLNTGTMKAVDNVINELKANEILEIKGFGISTLEKLKRYNIYTIDELVKNKDKLELNRIQKLGIKYYNDLKKDIPRKEIEEIYSSYIQNELDKNTKLHNIVGSYRRGKDFSGDIDIVVGCNKCMTSIKENIMKNNNFIDIMYNGKHKFSFLIKHNDIVRQVDILIVEPKSYYTALMHFTGSGTFNEKIRAFAKKNGITINEYYILKNKVKYYPKSEREIFNLVGIDTSKYLSPKKRV